MGFVADIFGFGGGLTPTPTPTPTPLPAPAPTPVNSDIAKNSSEHEVNKRQRRAAGFSSTQLSDRTLLNVSQNGQKQTLG